MKVLVTGITGQDGFYLSKILLDDGYEVHGLIRRSSGDNMWIIKPIEKDLILHYGDLENEYFLCTLLHQIRPDEIYNLAAQTHVGISFKIPEYTCNITGMGVLRLLEAVKEFSPNSKIYQASTSELFGNSPAPQNENTMMNPTSPYACAKLMAHHLCRVYRESYGMFISCGILFNHESPLRGDNFVTRKIAIHAAKKNKVSLGNLEAKRDWGYAHEYCQAMRLMLKQEVPGDFVVGTGETHSVREFAERAYELVGLNYKEYVTIDRYQIRPSETSLLCADVRKAKQVLGWRHKVTFDELVKIMVDSELTRF